MSDGMVDVMDTGNQVFAYIFLGELMLKHFAIGFHKYWRDNWNRFDGLIVTLSMVEIFLEQAFAGKALIDATLGTWTGRPACTVKSILD